MIGSQEDAARALAGDMPILSLNGSTRVVYSDGDVVYKVENGGWDYSANRAEYENAANMTDLPEGVYIPQVALYEVNGIPVIAMEYIQGRAVAECYCDMIGDTCVDYCMPADVLDKISPYLDDTSGMNTIITDTGDIYLIDLA